MTPRPKAASGPLVAQPALHLPLGGSMHRTPSTTTTTIKAGEFLWFLWLIALTYNLFLPSYFAFAFA